MKQQSTGWVRGIERRWSRSRLWFKRRARTNVVFAVLATVAAWIGRPFRRFRRGTRQNLLVWVLAGGVAMLLAFAVLSQRGSSGPQQVRAAEAPTTTITETTSSRPADAPLTAPVDTTPPALLLDAALTDGLTVGTNHIVLSGVTDPGASVVVAGIKITAGETGSWAADVPLDIGTNRIDIVVTDQAGNATGTAITIVYVTESPPPPPTRPPRRVLVTTTSIAPTTTTRPTTTTAKKTTTTPTPPTTIATTTGSETTNSERGERLGVLGTGAPTTDSSGTQGPATTDAATTTEASTSTTEEPTTAGTTTAVPPTDPPSTDPPPTDPEDTTTTTSCPLLDPLECLGLA